MKGKTTLTIATVIVFLLLAIVVFAPNFGDPSPDVGTPDNGNIINSTGGSNYTDGNFTSTQSDDNVYFTVGRDNPAGVANNLEAFINLTYNLTPIAAVNTQPQFIVQLIFNISYCHNRDVTSPSTCGAPGAQGTANTMDTEIYNWSSNSYVDIGDITQSAAETASTYSVNGSFADFVNSSNNLVNIRYEANFTMGNGNDAVFSIDFAPLTVIYDNVTPSVTLNSPANDFNITANNLTLNFTAIENNATLSCSIILNNVVNQTNASVANNTLTNFALNNIVHGNYNWSVNCTDRINMGASATRTFFVNRTPTLPSISDSPDPIKGGNVITITASGIEDPNNDTLNFFCATNSTPTAANTVCTGGVTTDTTAPYALNCTFVTAATDTANTVYCRVYDGESYSVARNTTYTTDSTQPSTTVANVANDSAAAYFDSRNDGTTNITVNGEAGMSCRFSTSDLGYSSMSNDCTISSSQAFCPVTTLTQGNYTIYVSCRDSVGNEQNSTNNLDVAFTLDYTAPNTTDNALTSIQLLGYNVTITESDNIDGDPDTLFCTDTANTCTPSTTIDNGGKVQFSSRGTHYLRYNSTDDAGNSQSIVSRTILVNQLPTFASAADDAAAIKGGTAVNITTASSSGDSGQNIALFVCKAASANSSGCSNSTNAYCSANGTANASCTFTSETDNAEHVWYAFVFDELNESAIANPRSGSYTTDSTAPSMTVSSPANTTLSQSSATAEIVINEAGDIAAFCLDSCSSNTTMAKVSSTLFTASLSNLSNGAHSITFYANDTVGNLANTTRAFTVDTTLQDTTTPTITVRSPVNGTYLNTTSILLNITADESLSTAEYSLNGTAFQPLVNNTGTQWNSTVTMNNGMHNVTFRGNDTSGNKNRGNSSLIFFFVDTTNPQNSTTGFTSSAVNDTSNITCSSSWTDNVALDVGFVEYNISGSFVNSTNTTFNGTSGVLNTTFAANSSLGSVGCRFYVFDKAGNTNRTALLSATISDITNPRFENLTYTPNSTDRLDPNVIINFTINATDNRAVSNVTVQYRLVNGTNYTSALMTSSGGNGYNASLAFGEGNWTFRMNITDTSGNSNTTAETNISVFNDDTFVNTTTIPSIKSFLLGERTGNSTLGNLTFNNTADYSLNFTITVTSPGSRVRLNGTANTTSLIPVPRGNVTTISVEANTTGLSAGLYNYSVYIEVQRNPVIGTENLTFQLNIQNSAGPVLDAVIDTYSANTTLGQTIDLASSVTNFGTSDATGVYLVWALPGNWTVVSGNATRNIGTLSPGIKATNTIKVSIGGTNGTFEINATANSTEGSTDIDSKAVEVGTPVVVTQTQIVRVPGPETSSGGGISPGVQIFTIDLNHAAAIVLNKKETGILIVNVTNPNRFTKLVNITLSVSGYSPVLISVVPEKIDIEYNKTKQFVVEIRAPAYIEAKEYELKLDVKAVAVASSISQVIKKSFPFSLVIRSVNESSARENVVGVLNISDELRSESVESKLILGYIESAKAAVQAGDYDLANNLVKKIKEARQKLLEAKSLLNDVKAKISQSDYDGIEVPETQKLYSLALNAFGREDYGRAVERARSALSAYQLETRGKANYLKLVQNWWWAFAIASIMLTYAGFLTYRKLALLLIGKRLISLRREEASLRDLIGSLKADYFVKKSIGRSEYHKSIYSYETRLAKVKKNIIRYVSKRAGMFNFQQSTQSLQGEETKIIDAIKDLQLKYFEAGSMSKAVYEKRFTALKSERVEVMRAIEIEKIRHASVERSIMHKAFNLVRNIFNTAIKYQEKAGSFVKFSMLNLSKNLSRLVSLLPHKRSVCKKQFGHYNAEKGWNPELGKRLMHATRNFMYKFGPLFLIALVAFAGLASMNSIRLTGFAALPASSELASGSINEAQLAIEEMQVLGFGVERVNDTLKEAKLFYQKGNFSLARERAAKIIELKDKAIYVDSQTDEFDLRLYNAEKNGTNTSEARVLFNEAVDAFMDEQYEPAESLLQQASQKLSDIESEEARQRALQKFEFDTAKFIKDNILSIIAATALLAVLFFVLYRKLELKLTIRKLRRLEQEKEVTERLLREAQQKYFQLGSWGKSDYESAKRRYEGKIIRLNRQIAVLRKAIPKLSKQPAR